MGLSLKVMGAFAVRDESGTALSLNTRKTRALLGYLAVNPDKPQPRERLMALLWGDRSERQARQSLNDALTSIRRLGSRDGLTILASDGEQVTLLSKGLKIDVERFRSLLPDNPAKAAALYDGPFLDGLSVPEPAFDEWLLATRSELHANVCDSLRRAVDVAANTGDIKDAIVAAKKLVALDPLREIAHRRLMQLLHASGDRVAALRQYQTCTEILKKELHVEPDSATKALFEKIKEESLASVPIVEARSRDQSDSENSSPWADKPSLAVLAFDNLSGDADQDYFADGMAEDLITELSRFRWFFVIARNSSFAYKGQALDVIQLARALGIQYVVEGSVRRAGDRVRIAVQLIDGTSGNHIWAERYDREVEDIFELQAEIAQTIAARIEPEMAAAERQRSMRKSPRSLHAWDLYQRGLSHYYQFTKQGSTKAQRWFRKAIEADPDFASAHARLAIVLQHDVFFGYTESRTETLDAALESARKALMLDTQDSLANFALGQVLIRRHDFVSAIPALETAIDLNPSSAHAYYGLGLALYYSGRRTEALPHLDRAARLGPNAPGLWSYCHMQARCHLDSKNYEAALEWAGRAVRQPNAKTIALAAFAAAAAYSGRYDTAKMAIDDLLRCEPGFCVQYVLQNFGNENLRDAMQHFADGLRKAGLPE